ncbi:MAG: class I SAM-dependent methyltransferase [Chlamydiales bacterium]|nr:class I SAM-dependent methyltransferase [Chlamydiales bacterium]
MLCRVCDANHFSLAVDLKDQPWGNHFLSKEEVGKEPYYPLRVIYCHKCKTAQLDFTVKKEVMFTDHTYLSGVTRSLTEHFNQTAIDVDNRFFKGNQEKTMLDIGSNDGSQLACYQNQGFDVLGVESSRRVAQIANEKGLPTVHAFFNLETAEKIDRTFDVINASGVFFHLEELHSVTEAIKKVLKKDGIFVVQFLYMKSIMENVAFDQIYHEHLLFYTLRTIDTLLQRHGLELFDAYLSPIHGGSMIAFVSHKGSKMQTERLLKLKREEEDSGCNELKAYIQFAKRIEILKEENLSYLSYKKSKGKTIYGMGAPVKGNTLLNYFDIGKELLDCLIEKNELRKGLFSPGKHLPILIEKELVSPPDVYYVLAWNFKREILKNNQELIKKGVEFYFPIDPERNV